MLSITIDKLRFKFENTEFNFEANPPSSWEVFDIYAEELLSS